MTRNDNRPRFFLTFPAELGCLSQRLGLGWISLSRECGNIWDSDRHRGWAQPWDKRAGRRRTPGGSETRRLHWRVSSLLCSCLLKRVSTWNQMKRAREDDLILPLSRPRKSSRMAYETCADLSKRLYGQIFPTHYQMGFDCRPGMQWVLNKSRAACQLDAF